MEGKSPVRPLRRRRDGLRRSGRGGRVTSPSAEKHDTNDAGSDEEQCGDKSGTAHQTHCAGWPVRAATARAAVTENTSRTTPERGESSSTMPSGRSEMHIPGLVQYGE
ncbi:MAG: hypothetical protein QOD08_1583 [Gaiellaceae bacterium]|nr:hypothetical protein [Gaiellaceae bacterium]